MPIVVTEVGLAELLASRSQLKYYAFGSTQSRPTCLQFPPIGPLFFGLLKLLGGVQTNES